MDIKKHNNIYFQADWHLGPNCFRTLSQRGFGTNWVQHMEHLRKCIQETVSRNDILFILGDLGFKGDTRLLGDFIKSLKCQVFVCYGNHDSEREIDKLKKENVICDCRESYRFNWQDNSFHLSHFPLKEWHNFYRGGYHLYGHTHANIPQYLRSMDVGIDNIGYYPIHIKDVISKLSYYKNTENGKRID